MNLALRRSQKIESAVPYAKREAMFVIQYSIAMIVGKVSSSF